MMSQSRDDLQTTFAVLIVEDEQTIAEIVYAIVEDAGYRPIMAQHGREALEIARTERPALIITDLMMPHMTGADLIAALRNDAKAIGAERIPVILMTAANSAAAHAAGANAVLYKPFDVDALEALVHRLIKATPVTP